MHRSLAPTISRSTRFSKAVWRLVLGSVAGWSLACSGPASPAAAATNVAPRAGGTSAEISAADLRERLFRIADDSTMGRETGSVGAFATSAYVAGEFARLGLEPAGDNGGWFQVLPMWQLAADPSSTLAVASSGALTVFKDFMPSSSNAATRTLTGAAVIYAGSISDTAKWIAPARAQGKVVLIQVPAGTSFRPVRPLAARYRSALAVIIVGFEDVPAETVARLREGQPVTDSFASPVALPSLWVTRRAANTIIGHDIATAKPGDAGRALTGRFGYLRAALPAQARNVVGIFRGSDAALRTQYVALTAHHDHVGFDHSPVDHDSLRAFNTVIRPMGADSPVREPTSAEWTRIRFKLDSLRRLYGKRLDSIRNGADDDGSGTASILEIAEAFSRGLVKPKRSILFVSHTGEEAGLLGSAWFTDHSTVPTDSIVAEIDQDMVGRGTATDFPRGGTGAGSDTYLEVIGAKRISKQFGDMLEQANAKQSVPFVFDVTFDAPGHPLQYYCRADHYNYARYGIPAVAFSRGEHQDYHQVTDEAQYISYPDLQRVSRMVFDAALLIANAPMRPKSDVPKPKDPHAQCRQ